MAGGDLAGTYPNPTIKDGAITTSKFANGATAPNADLFAGLPLPAFLQAGNPAGGVLTGSYPNPGFAPGAVAPDTNRFAGLPPQAFLLNGNLAGGDLAGTYPNPTIKDGAITTTKFAAGATAPNANALNGLPSTAFLPVNGKAADADKLDGLDSTAFLPVNGKAADADKLDGQSSSAFVPSCPAGMTKGLDLCVTAVSSGNFAVALTTCQSKGLRLPTPTEVLEIFDMFAPTEDDWTTDITDTSHAISLVSPPGINGELEDRPFTDSINYRCVSTPLATGTGSLAAPKVAATKNPPKLRRG